MRFFIILFSIFFCYSKFSFASGCDCSCWGLEDTVVESSRYSGVFFKLEGAGEKLRVAYNYDKYPKQNRKVGPFFFSGLEDGRSLHPKLLKRIIDEKPRFTVELQNVDMRLDGECSYEVFKTGRVKVTFNFSTGEYASLVFPNDNELISYEYGELKQESIVPLFDPIWIFSN